METQIVRSLTDNNGTVVSITTVGKQTIIGLYDGTTNMVACLTKEQTLGVIAELQERVKEEG